MNNYSEDDIVRLYDDIGILLNAAKKYFAGLTDKNELKCLINNIRKNL